MNISHNKDDQKVWCQDLFKRLVKTLKRWYTGLPHIFKIQLSNLLCLPKNSLKIILLFINFQIKFEIKSIISTSPQCTLPNIANAVDRGE